MKKWLERPNVLFCLELIQIYLEKKVSRASAQLAYYILLSIFPVLIVVSAILGMLPLSGSDLLGEIIDVLPAAVGSLLDDYLLYVQNNQSVALISGGVIMTITASSAAFRGLMDIFGEVFGQRVRGGIIGVIFSILLSILMLVLIYGSLLIVLLGDWLLGMIQFLLDMPVVHYSWRLAQILMPFGLIFCVLALIYRLTARTPRHKRMVLPGALLAAVVLVAATSLFSTFIGVSSRYATVYGSLASVIILMVWLFLCSNILIMGNIFNFVRARHRELYGTGRLPRLHLKKNS
ncbi:MAG: YihY/virulence factor BrkB family protein [Candidatus Onthomonas sp.]